MLCRALSGPQDATHIHVQKRTVRVWGMAACGEFSTGALGRRASTRHHFCGADRLPGPSSPTLHSQHIVNAHEIAKNIT
jgi:hypothetical protein